ncbi:MAG: DUF4214 domain-containing protein [Burkholderiaceae bacterium]|nr:DUF4214 domain-containing protein [Burkholderiaceae bacterium]
MATAKSIADVQKSYVAFYHRPADSAGLIYWADRLDATGGSLQEIINDFANSKEAAQRYFPGSAANLTLNDLVNKDTISGVINEIYKSLLNREADSGGMTFYRDGFNNGVFTPGTIALAVINGVQGDDAATIAGKLTTAQAFSEVVDGHVAADPLFGRSTSFNATYAGDADAQAAREFLKASTGATTLEQTTQFIVSNIADPGDRILQKVLIGGPGGDALIGGAGNDSLIGGDGNDSIVGGAGNDTLDGGADNDSLSGGVGDDSLIGGSGNDTLIGGSGNDTIDGGNGTDTVVFESTALANGVDTIKNFTAGSGGDVLDFRAFLGATTLKADAPLLGVAAGGGGILGDLLGGATTTLTDNDTAPNDDMDAYLSQGGTVEQLTTQLTPILGNVTGATLNSTVNSLASDVAKSNLANATIATLKVLPTEATNGVVTVSFIDSQFGGSTGVFTAPETGEKFVILASVDADPTNTGALPANPLTYIFYVEHDANDAVNQAKVTLVGTMDVGAGNDVDNLIAANFA